MTAKQVETQAKRRMQGGWWLLILLALGVGWWLAPAKAPPTTAIATGNAPVGSVSAPTTPGAADNLVQPLTRLGTGRSTQVAFARQQSLVAVATAIGVYLYDARHFTRLDFRETKTPVQTVTFAPDGAEVAFSTSGPQALLYRWRLADDNITTHPLDEALIHGLVFSPDGAYLVGMNFYHLLIWDAADMHLRLAHEQAGAFHQNIAFAPDSRLLVALARDRLELWRLGENTLQQTITPAPGRYFNTEAVAFSPTGAHLAVAGLREPVVYTWQVTKQDTLTAAVEQHLGNAAGVVQALQFAPDGERLAIGLASGAFMIQSLAAPTTTAVPLSVAAAVDRVTWSADSALVAAGAADGSVHLWSGERMAIDQILRLPPSATVRQIAHLQFTAEADKVSVTLTNGALYQWRLADGQLLHSLEEHSLGQINSISYMPDGAHMVIGAEHGVVQLWEQGSARPVSTYHTAAGHVDTVAVAPDGAQLAAALSRPLALGVWADPIQLLNIPAGAQPLRPFADEATVTTLNTDDSGFITTCGIFWNRVVFSPDGSYLAASSYAHKALLWRRADHALLRQFAGHTSAILDLAFSPDSTLLATASDDGEVRIWQTTDGQMSDRLPDHAGGAVAVAFSPDGQWLATRAALGDVRLWRLADGSSLLIDTNVKNPRSNLAFSPDGAFLASGTMENAALLWSVADSTQAYLLQGHNGIVNGVAFAPDGAHLATAAADGTVQIWPLPTVRR